MKKIGKGKTRRQFKIKDGNKEKGKWNKIRSRNGMKNNPSEANENDIKS